MFWGTAGSNKEIEKPFSFPPVFPSSSTQSSAKDLFLSRENFLEMLHLNCDLKRIFQAMRRDCNPG